MKLLIILILIEYIFCFQNNKIIKYYKIPNRIDIDNRFIIKTPPKNDDNSTSQIIKPNKPILPIIVLQSMSE
jgi:hypothetical protein